MARRKKGDPVHGWVILDKPIEMTSNQALGAVRRIFNAQKAGHAGTLDPLATGVLPIALGEATKTVSYAVDGEKAYRYTVAWGAETSTDDAEGEVTQTSDARPTLDDIENILDDYVGDINQTPPQFSAVKIAGERAYKIARRGEQIEIASRTVAIEDIAIVAQPDATHTVFEVTCGKGTYVRALARDMGRQLGCFGHIVRLRRTAVAQFDEAQAITLDDLRMADAVTLAQCLRPIDVALGSLPHFAVSDTDAALLMRGQPVLMRGRDAPVTTGAGYATCRGEMVALVDAVKGTLNPSRVFNFG